MCIIAAKPAGVPAPDQATLRNMWDGNPDGAGFMYVKDGKVRIEKGFMKWQHFIDAWDKLGKTLDLTAAPAVLHFRITTHGGTCPANCHPFPITDNVGALQKLKISTDLGVAHNGIIHIVPRKGISDTMEYIATQLAPLKQALPRFYENKHAMRMVKNAIDSRMVFLTGEGKLYTIGDFVEDKGILYSNSSFRWNYRGYNWGCYGGWDDFDFDFQSKKKSGKKSKTKYAPTDYGRTKPLMWLDESDIILDEDGNMFEAYDFLLGEDGTVYEYDWNGDVAVPCPGTRAMNAEGLSKVFDDEAAVVCYIDD